VAEREKGANYWTVMGVSTLDQLVLPRDYLNENGKDMPEIREWKRAKAGMEIAE
jgi:hypothetical protein